MRLAIAAALALVAASSLQAQTVPTAPATDYSAAVPLTGAWNYAPSPGGSEATFVDASAHPQLILTCSRATRQVTIAKPATAAAPFLFVWTTAQVRNLPASYNPATYRLGATVPAFDPLLDAMAFSRGRFAVSVSGQPALVVPSWEEVARVVEDCRV